ncbi:MAG: CopD family protein [Lewinellaceae bacterium]|nr:CopD family protein [Lewinellaceae bacterium]
MEVANLYSIAKAIHLIGMASWMAGMFYLVRIMVYHAMAGEKENPEREILSRQFVTMEWKAYKIILRPAVVITWSFGVMMLCIQPLWFCEETGCK